MSQPAPPPAAQPRNWWTCVHRNARHAAEAGHCPEATARGHEAPLRPLVLVWPTGLATAPTGRPKETLTP